jgi:hypothetical protein
VTGCGVNNRFSIHGRCKNFCLHPYRPRGSSSRYQGLKRSEHEAFLFVLGFRAWQGMTLLRPLALYVSFCVARCSFVFIPLPFKFMATNWRLLAMLRGLTYSMVQDIIWKADCHSSCQKCLSFFMEPEGSLPCPQKSATGPYPEPVESSSSHRSLSS